MLSNYLHQTQTLKLIFQYMPYQKKIYFNYLHKIQNLHHYWVFVSHNICIDIILKKHQKWVWVWCMIGEDFYTKEYSWRWHKYSFHSKWDIIFFWSTKIYSFFYKSNTPSFTLFSFFLSHFISSYFLLLFYFLLYFPVKENDKNMFLFLYSLL